MSVEFKDSQTKENLMRAFAGESQARNRYTFAAGQAKKENLYVIQAVFEYTANQEKEHAEIFYNHLSTLAGDTIHIDGGYPIDIADRVEGLLRMARHNEYEEHDPIYKTFGDTAQEEGFTAIADSFHKIAEIEKLHGDRFDYFLKLMENGELFVSKVEEQWICLNCGYVMKATEAPGACPVCYHDRGYFIRLELSPYIK